MCQKIIERKFAERNMVHFTDEEKIEIKYDIFIFNNQIFLDPALLLKKAYNSDKKMFLKDTVISVTLMM